jgi:hypothetical protein
MNGDTREQVARELAPHEQLLWWGRPRQGFVLRASDAYIIPFSFLWAGFAVFWETIVNVSRAPLLFRLWGIPFVLAGLYITVGRFYVDAKTRAGTFYGITNERALIVSGRKQRKVKSYQLRTLSDVTLTEASRGQGTITLSPRVWDTQRYWPGVNPQTASSFEMIDDARRVYETLLKAQSSSG